ncbi:hypothetical protein DOTSEDRAFT_71064 [Dothistroma septosporum NZE10]|uniref:Uncharacterized protein n=1 Tax=Dothistroma septosporum (strain NZE10 / CBS 128990) TaxID=675120 RepID=N1PP77_DOTSN|nr:hypothetical protein DOTSEDRAFT_71064 [Dothistroma septosporum NZE10]
MGVLAYVRDSPLVVDTGSHVKSSTLMFCVLGHEVPECFGEDFWSSEVGESRIPGVLIV